MKKILATTLAIIISLTLTPSTFASSKTPIMGSSVLTATQMETFLDTINKDAPNIAHLFLEEGEKEGVRGDIAFAQSLKETGYFRYGGVVQPDYNNYAGIGATDPTAIGKAARFNSPREGVRAQIQHLKAYASTDPLSLEQIDPRFHLVTRGIAPNIEDLNGRWAVPGNGYGESIMSIYKKISQTETTKDTAKQPVTFTSIEKPKNNRIDSLRAKLRQRIQKSFVRCRSIRAIKQTNCTPTRKLQRKTN